MASCVREGPQMLIDRGPKCWLQLGCDREEGKVMVGTLHLRMLYLTGPGVTALSLPERLFRAPTMLLLIHPLPGRQRGWFCPELPPS